MLATRSATNYRAALAASGIWRAGYGYYFYYFSGRHMGLSMALGA